LADAIGKNAPSTCYVLLFGNSTNHVHHVGPKELLAGLINSAGDDQKWTLRRYSCLPNLRLHEEGSIDLMIIKANQQVPHFVVLLRQTRNAAWV